jgi:hypothetical protein
LSGDCHDPHGSSQRFRRAPILLKAYADGSEWSDVKIAEAFDYCVQTIENIPKRLLSESLELALNGKKRPEPPTPCKLDGEAEAKRIAMRWDKPPAGYGHWTLQLLADELMALEVVDSISHETVRQTLKNSGGKRSLLSLFSSFSRYSNGFWRNSQHSIYRRRCSQFRSQLQPPRTIGTR